MHTRGKRNTGQDNSPRKKGRRGSIPANSTTTIGDILNTSPVGATIEGTDDSTATEVITGKKRKPIADTSVVSEKDKTEKGASTRKRNSMADTRSIHDKKAREIPVSASSDALIHSPEKISPSKELVDLFREPLLSSPLKPSLSRKNADDTATALPIKQWDKPALHKSESTGTLPKAEETLVADAQTSQPMELSSQPPGAEVRVSPSKSKPLSQSSNAITTLAEKQIIYTQMTNNYMAQIIAAKQKGFQQMIYIDHMEPDKAGVLDAFLKARAANGELPSKVTTNPVTAETKTKVLAALGPMYPRLNIRLFHDEEGKIFKVDTADIRDGKINTPVPVASGLFAFVFVKHKGTGVRVEEELIEFRLCVASEGAHLYLIGSEEKENCEVIGGGELIIHNQKFLLVNTKTGNFNKHVLDFEKKAGLTTSANEYLFKPIMPKKCQAPAFKFYDWNAISDEEIAKLIDKENLKIKILEKPLNFLLRHEAFNKVEIADEQKSNILESLRDQIIDYLNSVTNNPEDKIKSKELAREFYVSCVASNKEIEGQTKPNLRNFDQSRELMIQKLEQYLLTAIEEMRMLIPSDKLIRNVKAAYCDLLLHKELLKLGIEEVELASSKFYSAVSDDGKTRTSVFPVRRFIIPDVNYSFFPQMYDDWHDCFIRPARYLANFLNDQVKPIYDPMLLKNLLFNKADQCIKELYQYGPDAWDAIIINYLEALHILATDREKLLEKVEFIKMYKNSIALVMHYRDKKSFAFCKALADKVSVEKHSIFKPAAQTTTVEQKPDTTDLKK